MALISRSNKSTVDIVDNIVIEEWRQRDQIRLFREKLFADGILAHGKVDQSKMKYTAMGLSLCLIVSTGAFAGQAWATEASKTSQTISRSGFQPSVKGPAEYFTGNVRIDPLFPAIDSADFFYTYGTFEPGARSAWHIQPARQHLLITAGVDLIQEWEAR